LLTEALKIAWDAGIVWVGIDSRAGMSTMTDKSEEWDAEAETRDWWEPKTPREEREPLRNAPLATLSATPMTQEAFRLMGELAKRYPRPQAAKGKTYARGKTLVPHANAVGAFVADLLDAVRRDRSDGWLRCSHKKADYTGQYVTWPMFDNVRRAFLEAELVDRKRGFPGWYNGLASSGPISGKLTRYRATPALLEACAKHGVTPDNVREHFRFKPLMPSELVRLTKPPLTTPETPKVHRLRADVEALNAFIREHHTITHPTTEIRHLGWVRIFHRADHPDFRWNKGGRLYSYPQDAGCYQHLPETERVRMLINDEEVVEIDISSAYLTIFYGWFGEQLDTNTDAYADILGPTKLDREVAKFWINISFGNGKFLTRWGKGLVTELRDRLQAKNIAPGSFNPRHYPMRVIKERVLTRHPHLQQWGGDVRGRVRDFGDLMYAESEIVIGAMRVLMDKGIPSLPVHDSVVVPISQEALAMETIIDQFGKRLGVVPKLDVTRPA
jgi:hypothetical protein